MIPRWSIPIQYRSPCNTIPKSSLRRLICTLPAAKMSEVKTAIMEALDLQ
jgi:mRNA-degrading endonuclease toxin of MazEF toxin-antitoxin module